MLSTMTCWPSSSDSRGVRMRATTSIGPPAANGTTTVGGRAGQSCAGAAAGNASAPASRAPMMIARCIRLSSIGAGAARLDRAGPALDLARHELAEIVRRAALRRRDGDADALEALAHRRRLHRVVRRLGEPLHDRRRRSLRERERAPAAAVEPGEPLLLRGRQVL